MTDDLRRRHYQALKTAFEFAQAPETSWRAGADQSCANQVRIARDCIARGIPFGTDSAELLTFLLGNPWSKRIDVDALWKEYAAAGYIDTAQPLQMHCKRGPLKPYARNGFVTLLPLEMAVALEHEKAFEALIRCGARLDRLPSRQWKPVKRAPMDAFGFLKFMLRSDKSLATFRTAAARALGATPLEIAILTSDLPAFASLVDAGADITKVPSRQWDASARKPMDALAFIKFAVKSEQLRQEIGAVAVRALMLAQIAHRIANPPPAPPAPSPKRAPKPTKPAKSKSASVANASAQLGLELELADTSTAAAGSSPHPACSETVADPAPVQQPTGPILTPRQRRGSI